MSAPLPLSENFHETRALWGVRMAPVRKFGGVFLSLKGAAFGFQRVGVGKHCFRFGAKLGFLVGTFLR